LLEAEKINSESLKEDNDNLREELKASAEKLSKEFFVTEMKYRTEDMEKELEAKIKEIEELREANCSNCSPLDLHINIQAPEFDKELEEKLKKSQEEIEGLSGIVGELNKRIEDLEKDLKKKKNGEIEYKRIIQQLEIRGEAAEQANESSNIAIIELTSARKELIESFNKMTEDYDKIKAKCEEISIGKEQLASEVNKLEEENTRKDVNIKQLSASLKKEQETEEEMRGEISVLIKQYKLIQNTLKTYEIQLIEQKNVLESQDMALQQKAEESKKREAYIMRLARQLENVKEQMRLGQLKIKQLNKNPPPDNNKKLTEIDKEMRSMKEMIKNNQYEILVKNKEIAILKDSIKRLKFENEIKDKLISVFANNEDHAKELKKIEDELEENENKEDDIGNVLPIISSRKNQKVKVEIPIELREKYMNKYNNYMKLLEEHELNNNSSTMRSLLRQNNSLDRNTKNQEMRTVTEIENPDDVIRRSLIGHTDRPSKTRILKKDVHNSVVLTPVMRKYRYRTNKE